jgi:cardiolipin synthase (CMP-forming)
LTLGFTNHLPVWLVIAVVSRDILIIGAFILSWMLSRPVTVHPLLVSKANTVAQLVLASLVLAELGLGLGLEPFVATCIWVTGALTILSATVYFWVWLKHMASYESQRAPLPARKSPPEPIRAGSRVRTS